jgi:hypothetical protein
VSETFPGSYQGSALAMPPAPRYQVPVWGLVFDLLAFFTAERAMSRSPNDAFHAGTFEDGTFVTLLSPPDNVSLPGAKHRIPHGV